MQNNDSATGEVVVNGTIESEMFCESSWSLVVAANSDELLRNNLLRSGEFRHAKEVVIRRDALSAAIAYNAGMSECTGDLVVFAHQDVFLPDGWAERLKQWTQVLAQRDPNWGVLGVYGVTTSGNGAGYVYSLGLGRFVGSPIAAPIPIATLDEMLLIIRRCSGLRFDDNLPGFHLYGTDICVEAKSRGMQNYVLPCFTLHNSKGLRQLPRSYWKAYMYLRRKWRRQLPISTPCATISSSYSPMVAHISAACWSFVRGRDRPGSRVSDPLRFYHEHIAPVVDNPIPEASNQPRALPLISR